MQKNMIGNHFTVKAVTMNVVCVLGHGFTNRDQVKCKFQWDGLPWSQRPFLQTRKQVTVK